MAETSNSLKDDIISLLETMKADETSTEAQANQTFAEGLSAAIEKYVTSRVVRSGITVQVNTGTGTGATTSIGTIE